MGEQVAAGLKRNKKIFDIDLFISFSMDRESGGVAQLGEHLPCKQGVKSSNLSISIR